MRFLKFILAIARARWFLTLLGAVILALLVWFFGELLAIGDVRPFTSETARLVAILVITVTWGASNLWAQRRLRKGNEQLLSDLAAAPPLVSPAEVELEEVRERFTAALKQLETRRLQGRRYLSQLPWYLLIGPPGCGKTTALLQSGLRFPLGTAGQGHEVSGIGGTRNCDWFFTDEAVLIDTAGRYTSQDSDAEADQAAWLGFLDLLRRHRRRRALNGVLVAFAADDLMRSDRDLLAQYARAIRSRLNELAERLEITFPVYLVITKCDLIAGFEEYFADLSERDREQVWGATFELDPEQPKAPDRALIEQDMDALVVRLEQRLLGRMQAEQDLERRASVFRFPTQVAGLKPLLVELVSQISYESSFETRVFLRGVYLTSGTQKRTPIDQLMQAMAANFGLPHRPPSAGHGARSFFLTRLLRDVIFAEGGLVARDPKRERRERWLEQLAWGAAAALVLGLGLGWGWGFIDGRREIARGIERIESAHNTLELVARSELSAPDRAILPILPALNRLEEIPNGEETSFLWRLGLSPGYALAGSADVAYRNGLSRLLLPRLVLRVREDLRARITDPEFVLQGLKVYLMLTADRALDRELIDAWFIHIDRIVEEGATLEEVQTFAKHRAALFEAWPSIREKPKPEAELVEAAQATLREIPLAHRAYNALLELPEARALQEWWPSSEHAGPNAPTVLKRRSGRPLTQGIAGLYTYDGFHRVMLPSLADVAAATAVESWVLGIERAGERTEAAELEGLQADVLKLYYDDYIAFWDQLLSDVTLATLPNTGRTNEDIAKAVTILKDLAGPSSAMKIFLTAVLRETQLIRPPDEGDEEVQPGVEDALGAGKRLLGKLAGPVEKVAKLARQGRHTTAVPGEPVTQHFRYLVEVVEGVSGAPPEIDGAIGALGELLQTLQGVALSRDPAKALLDQGGMTAVAGALARDATRMSPPLDGWLSGVAEQAGDISGEALAGEVNAIWQVDVLPFCTKALAERFPFDPSSSIDVSLEDFARLFGPGGAIDQFVSANLAQLVDMASRPWRWRSDYGLSAAGLAQLEQARRIRDAMFASGATPQAGFTLTPLDLDSEAARVLLNVGGQEVAYRHGPRQSVPLVWPAPGSNVVRLTFFPVGQGAPAVRTYEGAWSLFRLLREGNLQSIGGRPDLFDLTVAHTGQYVTFELQAASVDNPFNLSLLSGFRCPGRI